MLISLKNTVQFHVVSQRNASPLQQQLGRTVAALKYLVGPRFQKNVRLHG